MRADIRALFSTLGGTIQYYTMKYKLSRGFFLDVFYQIEENSFYA